LRLVGLPGGLEILSRAFPPPPSPHAVFVWWLVEWRPNPLVRLHALRLKFKTASKAFKLEFCSQYTMSPPPLPPNKETCSESLFKHCSTQSHKNKH
jgi:hypothetical protein